MRLMGGIIANQREMADAPDGLWPATTDPRIQAVVALAPWNVPVFGLDGLAALDIPALIEVGTGDTTTPPERDAYRAYAHIGSPLKALVAYGGGGHLIFADDNEDSFDAVWTPDAVHPLINHFTTAFLLATLYDDAEAAALLTPETVAAADLSGIGYAATFGTE